MLAIQVWNFLADRMGGYQFDGLDAALVMFEPAAQDLEMLLWQLDFIKRYSPPKGPANGDT